MHWICCCFFWFCNILNQLPLYLSNIIFFLLILISFCPAYFFFFFFVLAVWGFSFFKTCCSIYCFHCCDWWSLSLSHCSAGTGFVSFCSIFMLCLCSKTAFFLSSFSLYNLIFLVLVIETITLECVCSQGPMIERSSSMNMLGRRRWIYSTQKFQMLTEGEESPNTWPRFKF